MTGTCEDCAYNVYDDEMDEYVYRVQTCGRACPYYRSGDDYELVRHQN